MTDVVNLITEFLGSFFSFISTFFDLVSNYISKGLGFVSTLFHCIPNFLTNTLFSNIPPFFQSAFYGIFGFMMLIILVKLISILLLK